MATINDYRIVVKSFNGDNELYRNGQVVNILGFRNVRGLEEGRYLRRPNSEEDFQLITAFMEQEKNSVQEPNLEPEQEQENTVSKRGRPSKSTTTINE